MKILFLTIALGIFIFQAQESESSEEFEGTFYIKAIVGDKEIPEGKRPKALSPLTISHLDDGNLEAKFTIMKDGECKEVKMKLEKSDDPRKFIFHEGQRQLYITKTSEPNHWILFCEGELFGHHIKMAKLVGTNMDANPNAMNDFKDYIQGKGLKEEKIIFPEQEETCIPEEA